MMNATSLYIMKINLPIQRFIDGDALDECHQFQRELRA